MKETMSLIMANNEKKSYDFDPVSIGSGSVPINVKIECIECVYCAPNTVENKILGLQPRDKGACFKDFPTKVSVIVPNFKKEISCRKLK